MKHHWTNFMRYRSLYKGNCDLLAPYASYIWITHAQAIATCSCLTVSRRYLKLFWSADLWKQYVAYTMSARMHTIDAWGYMITKLYMYISSNIKCKHIFKCLHNCSAGRWFCKRSSTITIFNAYIIHTITCFVLRYVCFGLHISVRDFYWYWGSRIISPETVKQSWGIWWNTSRCGMSSDLAVIVRTFTLVPSHAPQNAAMQPRNSFEDRASTDCSHGDLSE